MNKSIKYGLLALIGLMVLALAAAAILAASFDPNRYKPEIERIAKEKTGRTLKLAGKLELAFFPSIGAKVAGVSFSERGSEQPFVSLESAQVAVKLAPLLHGEVIVDALSVAGLKAQVVKGKDGKFNFDDLLGGEEAKKPAAATAPSKGGGEAVKFDISAVKVERSAVTYRDLAKGSEIALSEVKLSTGHIAEKAEGKLELSAQAKGKNPDLDVKLELGANYRVDLPARSFELSKLDARLSGAAAGLSAIKATAKGDVAANPQKNEYRVSGLSVELKAMHGKDALEAKLDAPSLVIAADSAKGDAVSAEFKLKGENRSTEAVLKLSGVQGSAKSLVIPKLSADVSLASPDLPMKSVKIPVSGSLRADLEKQTASADLSSKFDESTIKAKLGLVKFTPASYVFDIDVDRLNLDRYLKKEEVPSKPAAGGAPKPAAAKHEDTPVDLSALKDLNANGKLQVGALQVHGLKLANVKAEVRAANGRMDIAPHTANLYEGSVSGAVSLQADNRVSLKETLSNVSVGPLLRDVAKQERLEGKGNLLLDVVGAGKSVDAMKKSLGGSAKLNLKDGAIKGFDIAGILRKAKSAFSGGQSAQAASATEKTDFSEFGASFVIKNGVAHNEDLDVKAPLFRLTGRGDIDIGNSKLDYVTKAAVVASAKGQGGEELGQLAGLSVPVRLSGPFDDLKYQVDYGAVAADLAKSKVGEKIKESIGGGKIGDRLKGLFGR